MTIVVSFSLATKLLCCCLLNSLLQARFSGPYEVDSKLSETDYVICAPDRRRKTSASH